MIRASSIVLAAAVAAVLAAPAQAVRVVDRTYAASLGVNGEVADGASTRPALSPTGKVVAFDSVATNLALDGNGPIRDVFARSLADSSARVVSQGPDGVPADGASHSASIGGSTIAFLSDATNLVAGDTNGRTDVFARVGTAPVRLLSGGINGPADGSSGSVDVAENGRFAAFVSTATNLVAGDSNGAQDVFVRDLQTNAIRRASRASGGGQSNGASSAPSISADGRYVVFASTATNLVDGDTNGIQDVFRADMRNGRVVRVTVDRRGRQQNRSVIEPFSQVADVSRDGRLVVFDSDATNLVPRDRNRDTDVFVRDVRAGRIIRVSVDKFGFEADNDSFNPSISADGRFIVFQSFAERLAHGDGPNEDVFIYDLKRFAPSVISVGTRGARRNRERTRQLLQRPVVSRDGQLVGFTSTASNLVRGDTNQAEDVFLRVTAAPRARIVSGPRGTIRDRRPRLRLRADDPAVRDFICNIDRVRFRCSRNGRLPQLAPGNHVLRVFAGGPGMLFQPKPLIRTFRIR